MSRCALLLRPAALFLLGFVLALPPFGQAQRPDVKSIVLPESRSRIILDGILADKAWQFATVIEDLTQVEPVPGAPATGATRVYFLRDARTLYVGVDSVDPEPEQVIARQLRRDASQAGDDRFVLTIDSLGTRRDGYLFSINPRGARSDSLIAGQNLNQNWDGIWHGVATQTGRGWSAEIAIPFSTLAFRDDGMPWGVNFERIVARRSETVRWAAPTRNQRVHYLGSAGRLEGVDGIDVGLGLEFRPYARIGWSRSTNQSDETYADTGFDLRWKPAPTISAALTVNTDFSETEVDDRLINLTRFSTFFPEKRTFFLEDAVMFEFGGISGSPLPFFSRRIGLDGRGQPVDLRVGLKSTGRAGPVSFGLIGAQTRDSSGEHLLGVLRGRADFFAESSAGFIFTRGNPAGANSDWLGGIDLSLQTSRWHGDRLVRFNAYALQSGDTLRDERGGAYGIGLRYPTDRFSLTSNLARIDGNFRPALGYVRQTGIYSATNKLVLRWHPAGRLIDSVDWGTALNHVTNLSGNLDYSEVSIFDFTMFSRLRDRAGSSWFVYREVLDTPLRVGPDVLVPAGAHDTQRFSAWVGTGDSRPLQVDLQVSYGGFYNGRSLETEVSATVASTAHFHFFVDHQFVAARLPAGDFDLHNLGVRADLQFTPDLNLSLVANWDSLSRDLGANVRLRWTVSPGRDFYVVFNQNVDTRAGWTPVRTGISSKAAWNFRF